MSKNNELWMGNRGLGKDFFFGITEASKQTNINYSAIQKCLQQTAGVYHWEYA